MKNPSAKSVVDGVNSELGKFTVNKYERNVPYGRIGEFLASLGFEPADPEDHPFALLGHEGRVSIDYLNKDYPSYVFWLHLTWYRMTSGNFEVVARFEMLSKETVRRRGVRASPP